MLSALFSEANKQFVADTSSVGDGCSSSHAAFRLKATRGLSATLGRTYVGCKRHHWASAIIFSGKISRGSRFLRPCFQSVSQTLPIFQIDAATISSKSSVLTIGCNLPLELEKRLSLSHLTAAIPFVCKPLVHRILSACC